MIIPTRYKNRIPQAYSYPLGAQIISSALSHTAQFKKLQLDFSFWPLLWRRNAIPCWILKVGYRNYPRSMTAMQWTISLQAVPKTIRHAIQGVLMEKALPEAANWLILNADKEERIGYCAITFMLNEPEITLISKEEEKLDPFICRSGK